MVDDVTVVDVVLIVGNINVTEGVSVDTVPVCETVGLLIDTEVWVGTSPVDEDAVLTAGVLDTSAEVVDTGWAVEPPFAEAIELCELIGADADDNGTEKMGLVVVL